MHTLTEKKQKEIVGKINNILAQYDLAMTNYDFEHLQFIKYRRLIDDWHRRMENFHPSDKDVKKIIAMNDGLHDRFRMVYDDMLEMKKKVDDDIKNGKIKVSGYMIFPEYFLAYDYDDKGIPTATGDQLVDLSDSTRFEMPRFFLTEDSKIPDFEKDFLNYDPECSFNIEWFNIPRLENHYIYMYMYDIFYAAHTFCLKDIKYLKPEDLEWQITVQYEKFWNNNKAL